MKIQIEAADVLADYAQHLKNLSPEDRYTRFCYAIKDHGIDQFVLSILYNLNDHIIFAAVVDGVRIGYSHLARDGSDWELAVSVDREFQGQGTADRLMKHAIDWGKTHGIHTVYMHCISQNTKIQHLARKHGLQIIDRDGGEITSRVELPEATPLDYTTNFLQEQKALYDQINALQKKMMANLSPFAFLKENDITH